MTIETVDVGAVAPAADTAAPIAAPAIETDKPIRGLDSYLSKAIADAEAPPDKGKDDPPEGTQTTESDGRPRDERGRFSSKDAAPEASDTGATEGAQTAVPPTAPEPAPAVQQLAAHARWDDALKAKFSALPPEAKQFALDVQAKQEAYTTRRDQEFASYRQAADPLLSAVQPFQQYLTQVGQQAGVAPANLISNLLDTEYKLRTGNQEQRVQALGQIMQFYGIDLAQIIGGQAAQQPGESGQPQFDPAILNLRQTNVRLENEQKAILAEINQLKQLHQQARDQEVLSEIGSFESEKAEDGSPKYPHYGGLKGIMAQFLSEGKAHSLKEAYDMAHDLTIKPAIARELANRQKAAEVANQAAVEKAKKAAPVKAATGSLPNGSTAKRGLDALLSENINKSGLY